MLSFEEARARIAGCEAHPVAERVPLFSADGRVLAEDVHARAPVPPWDTSAMDGYAVRVAELTVDAPTRLPVRGESRTGAAPEPLAPGAAMRIFTGAVLPEGADAVVMQEDVAREADVAVFRARPAALANVRRRGEDLEEGALALAKGTRLGPAQVGLLASLDRGEVLVARRPEVVILATGDELRPPGSCPRPASIPESNGLALAAMVVRAGGRVRVCPAVGDDGAATARAVEDALRGADLLLTIGGVSVGDHDVVRPALVAAGVEIDFWKVAMKPGKPLAVGRRGATWVLGLPGNPVSALVTFALFGVPLLRTLSGDRAPVAPWLPARLARAVRRRPGRSEFLRATLDVKNDQLIATPVAHQASGALVGLAAATALVALPAEAGDLEEGAAVSVVRLGDL
ncbi:MAG: molybdopterin molybdotransferase MoeA [Polyangiaceae bacterium]|nr:molybdopterin molybdotransferase MoeA [Polyangiaceae bacterium]